MLSEEQLKQILIEQRDSILKKEIGVEREVLKDVEDKIKLPHIMVLTGIRRSGKSTILRQIINKFYNNRDFYYINFEDERLFNFNASEFNLIYQTLTKLFGEKGVFFIDEIQNIANFEIFVRRFYDDGFKFFITGSNARLLSKELGTKLTGRHLDVIVNPFSFKEFLKLKDFKIEKKMIYMTKDRVKIMKYFDEYLNNGGMPEYITYEDIEILTRIYEDIIVKDIIARYKVNNIAQIKELYQYLITNFSNKFSFNNIKKIINFGSVNTIKRYISYLEETYLAKTVNKFDYSLKKQLINDKKIYIVDNGFIRIISKKLSKDRGFFLENLVFNVFNEKKFDIFYYSNKSECDFLLVKNRKINMAIQVCFELNNENKEREINGLLSAMDKFKIKNGMILTYNDEDEIRVNNKKIKIKPVWKMLLED